MDIWVIEWSGLYLECNIPDSMHGSKRERNNGGVIAKEFRDADEPELGNGISRYGETGNGHDDRRSNL
jgi:hypothetical protein